jgi:uncharacterized BrkB/YihY/UPF0761 family membrane protein
MKEGIYHVKKIKEDFKTNPILSIILLISEVLFLVFLLKLNSTYTILSLFLADSCASGITQDKLKSRISELESKINDTEH